MPVQSNDNFTEYVRLLGKMAAVAENENVDAVCIKGDFNANLNTRFYEELT